MIDFSRAQSSAGYRVSGYLGIWVSGYRCCTGYRSVDEAHVGTGGCLDALYRVSECR